MNTRTIAAAIALTAAAPAVADVTTAEEFFALSEDSAAERIVRETSEGNLTQAEVKFALSEMSAAERKVFFEGDEKTRLEMLRVERKLDESDSPAEMADS